MLSRLKPLARNRFVIAGAVVAISTMVGHEVSPEVADQIAAVLAILLE